MSNLRCSAAEESEDTLNVFISPTYAVRTSRRTAWPDPDSCRANRPWGLRPNLIVERLFCGSDCVFLILWALASGPNRPRFPWQCAIVAKVCEVAHVSSEWENKQGLALGKTYKIDLIMFFGPPISDFTGGVGEDQSCQLQFTGMDLEGQTHPFEAMMLRDLGSQKLGHGPVLNMRLLKEICFTHQAQFR